MALPGLSDAELGVALGVLWLVGLGVALVQYSRGAVSRSRLLAVAWMGLIWLSYSLLRVTDALHGPVESATVAVAGVLFVAGLALGVRWWRTRDAGPGDDAATGDATG